MTQREKRNIYAEVTDRILAELEKGVVPWHRPWTSTGFPYSLDGRPYRGINVFLLELAGYGDPRWGTFNAVQRHGGHVRKGEHATRVILWKPVRKRITGENGEEQDGSYLLLRDYAVFNAEQCEELPVLDIPEREHTPVEAAELLVTGYGDRPPVHYGSGQASYSPFLDRIDMPKPERFESEAAFYSTQFHELVHSTGHENRLKRIETALFGSDPYAREELVAEMGAAMLCGLSGLANEDQSAAYISGWLKALSQDTRLVIQAAAKAQRAVDYMLGVTYTAPGSESPTPRDPQLAATGGES